MQLPKLNFSKEFDFQFRQDKDKFLFMMYCAKIPFANSRRMGTSALDSVFPQPKTYAPSALIAEKK